MYHSVTVYKPTNLGPMLGTQALPVTSQDKVVSDRVTPLKKTLVQLVVPCKGPLPGYGEVLNGSVSGGVGLRYGEVGRRNNPSSWGQ